MLPLSVEGSSLHPKASRVSLMVKRPHQADDFWFQYRRDSSNNSNSRRPFSMGLGLTVVCFGSSSAHASPTALLFGSQKLRSFSVCCDVKVCFPCAPAGIYVATGCRCFSLWPYSGSCNRKKKRRGRPAGRISGSATLQSSKTKRRANSLIIVHKSELL